MKPEKLNSGVIFTNSKCIGCNKCISGCVAMGANVVVKNKKTDKYKVMVDPNKCILCGHCVEECVHNARTYRDDTDAFFEALANNEHISILVSPSLLTDYEKEYNNILGFLRNCGVRHIYNTGFGADIMVWVYMNFIHNFGLSGVISQFCPVIVNYIEKYKPGLLNYLMPVQSPLMCTAIYVSDYLGISDKLAYIGPCIAQKHETDDVNTYGKVQYNVTFERLMKKLEEQDITKYYAEDEVSYGLGSLICSAGGLSDNIKPYIGFNKVLIQTSGYSSIFPYFDHYYKDCTENGELPFLVDVLSCTNGCNFGTGSSCKVERSNQVTFAAHRTKERAYKSGNVPTALNYEERLGILNKKFESFELSSFVRQYSANKEVVLQEIDDSQIETVYKSMYKRTPAQRHTDCGSCGYKTCREMAYAIATNANHKENCINYAKECIKLETQKTASLLSEISSMNEELRKSAQLKSNFLANMSHEIRTPMNAVIGMAELALRGKIPQEERGYIQQIKASGRSLLAIINDILDFSKIESGKMEINETEYAVMSLINDTVNIVMTRIGEKDITLIVQADPTIPFTLRGDDIRIKQVIVNFTNNAIKFAESGFVKMSLSYTPRDEFSINLSVSIQDTGIGIKQDDIAKLFNSFQQVDSKRNRNIEGTGLGLAISREIVQIMGGDVSVESVYGKGSTFSFTIPQMIVDFSPSISLHRTDTIKTASLVDNLYIKQGLLFALNKFEVENALCSDLQDLKNAVKNGAEYIFVDYPLWNKEMSAFAKEYKDKVQTVVIINPHKDIITETFVRKINQPVYCLSIAAVFNKEIEEIASINTEMHDFRFEAPDANVLVVDDNSINLTVAKGLLSPLHMNLSTASGALEAIEKIKNNTFDIVFMDHMMPDIDGVEATHLIRALDGGYFSKLPIIALTANAINNAREMFLREGMNDFVAKPIDMADISAKIRKWLPPEKIKNLTAKDPVKKAKKDANIPDIKQLDVKAAIELSGTVELYLNILADYHSAINKKASYIEECLQNNDIKAYTIEVHALKSASKLIGATELSAKAAHLEKCGNENDLESIKELTPDLLINYRALEPILREYGKKEVSQSDKKPRPTNEILRATLEEIYVALDDFDIDIATQKCEELVGFTYSQDEQALFESLKEYLESMDYDVAMQKAKDWQSNLQNYSS